MDVGGGPGDLWNGVRISLLYTEPCLRTDIRRRRLFAFRTNFSPRPLVELIALAGCFAFKDLVPPDFFPVLRLLFATLFKSGSIDVFEARVPLRVIIEVTGAELLKFDHAD